MDNKLRSTFSGWQLTNPNFYEGLVFSLHKNFGQDVLLIQGHGGIEAIPHEQRRADDVLDID